LRLVALRDLENFSNDTAIAESRSLVLHIHMLEIHRLLDRKYIGQTRIPPFLPPAAFISLGLAPSSLLIFRLFEWVLRGAAWSCRVGNWTSQSLEL